MPLGGVRNIGVEARSQHCARCCDHHKTTGQLADQWIEWLGVAAPVIEARNGAALVVG